jgi:hypothetical protein
MHGNSQVRRAVDFTSPAGQESTMDLSPVEVTTTMAPPHAQPLGRRLLRAIYTNNPLYLISAWLVFSGLRASFNTAGETFETWAFLGGLACYSLLLATAACILIRLGKVWEDIRTLALLILPMFFAMSVSLDEALTKNPAGGSFWLTIGFAFAVCVSEALVAGLKVRLPLAYRIPYHLVLALLFLYPVALVPWVERPESRVLQWSLFAFSAAAGLVFLLLLPGIRRGERLLRHNGTPWGWPWYPLSLFFVLAVAVCFRAYYLCLSLHSVGYDWSIFGSYFLVPFLAALNVLWLELGITMQKRRITASALAAPLIWLWLAQSGWQDNAIYLGFLDQFQSVLQATPLFGALLTASAFFAMAALRRVPWAAEAWFASVAALTVVGPGTLTFGGASLTTGWPLIVVATGLLLSAVRRRESLRACMSAVAFVFGSAIELRGSWLLSLGLTPCGEVVPLEMLLGLLLVIGAIFHDKHASLVRLAAALLLIWVGGVVSARHERVLGEPLWLVSFTHVLFWSALAIAYARWLRFRYYYVAAIATAGTWCSSAILHGYAVLEPRVAGLREISFGLAFFVLAFAFSVWKSKRSGDGAERGVAPGRPLDARRSAT